MSALSTIASAAKAAKRLDKIPAPNWEIRGERSVPMINEGGYRNVFTVEMTPDQFLSRTIEGERPDKYPRIIEGFLSGNPMSTPYLTAQWDDTKNVWVVLGHEGRHRARAVRELYGEDTKIPVQIVPYDSDGIGWTKSGSMPPFPEELKKAPITGVGAAAGGAIGVAAVGSPTEEAQAEQQSNSDTGPTSRGGYRSYTLPGGFKVKNAPDNATQFDLVYSFYKTSGEGKERARRLAGYNEATKAKEKGNRQQYVDILMQELANYPELDKELILKQVEVESTFNPLALSEAGAMGLMQLTEIHWGEGQFNPLDPVQNVKAGLAYLYKHYKEHKGDYAKAFAAYHSGQTDVRKWIRKYGENWRRGLGEYGRRYLRDILGEKATTSNVEAPPPSEEPQPKMSKLSPGIYLDEDSGKYFNIGDSGTMEELPA